MGKICHDVKKVQRAAILLHAKLKCPSSKELQWGNPGEGIRVWMGLPWLLLLGGIAVTWDGDPCVPERLPVAMGHSWRWGNNSGGGERGSPFGSIKLKIPLQESTGQVSKPSFLENSLSSPPAAVSAHSSPSPLPKVICTSPSFEGQGWLERVGGAEDSRWATRWPRTVPAGAQVCISPGSS